MFNKASFYRPSCITKMIIILKINRNFLSIKQNLHKTKAQKKFDPRNGQNNLRSANRSINSRTSYPIRSGFQKRCHFSDKSSILWRRICCEALKVNEPISFLNRTTFDRPHFLLLLLTAGDVCVMAVFGRDPKIGRACVEHHFEGLWGRSQGDWTIVLSLREIDKDY